MNTAAFIMFLAIVALTLVITYWASKKIIHPANFIRLAAD